MKKHIIFLLSLFNIITMKENINFLTHKQIISEIEKVSNSIYESCQRIFDYKNPDDLYEKCKNISILYIQEYLPNIYENYDIPKNDKIKDLASEIVTILIDKTNKNSIFISIKKLIIQFFSSYGLQENIITVLTYQETIFDQILNTVENIVNNCGNIPMKSVQGSCIDIFYSELLRFLNSEDQKKLIELNISDFIRDLSWNKSKDKMLNSKIKIIELFNDILIENEIKKINENKVEKIDKIINQINDLCLKNKYDNEKLKNCLTPKIKSISLLLSVVYSPYTKIVDDFINISSSLVGKDLNIIAKEILILFLPPELQYKNKLEISKISKCEEGSGIVLCSWISYWFCINLDCVC